MLLLTRPKPVPPIIGTVLHPIFVVVGYVLAFFYGLIPNYAVAIALLTDRGDDRRLPAHACQRPLHDADAASLAGDEEDPGSLQGQARHAGVRAAGAPQKMNEEVMALYRENGVNPTGGCLPMFLQFPILIVLYDVVRGLSKMSPGSSMRPASRSSSTASRY